MLHTIYASKFAQMIIYQHVHLRRESRSHAPPHVLMTLYAIDKSLVCLQAKEERHVRIYNIHLSSRLSIYFSEEHLPQRVKLKHCFQIIPFTNRS